MPSIRRINNDFTPAGSPSLTDVRSGGDPAPAHNKKTTSFRSRISFNLWYKSHRARQEDGEEKADVIQTGGRWSWTEIYSTQRVKYKV